MCTTTTPHAIGVHRLSDTQNTKRNFRKRSWKRSLCAVVFAILPLAATAESQTIDHSAGFASHADLMNNGSATISGTVARLTDVGFFEAGSIFSRAKVCASNFSTSFTFQYVAGINCCGQVHGADGITFAMQANSPSALGGAGFGLGYIGIPNSAAVKFDTFDNVGEGINSTGFFSGGAAPFLPAFDVSPVHIYDTDVKRISLTYNGTTLVETITDTITLSSFSHTYTVNIPAAVGGDTAYVGFTGSTGAATSTQDIQTWTFDNPPVVISGVSVDKPVLWPPNHKMTDVTVSYGATGCGSPACTLSVSSNEPVNGVGDGNTSPDWAVIDAHHVQLRQERSGKGSGRIYTILIRCVDDAGDVATSTATVAVPHDQGH